MQQDGSGWTPLMMATSRKDAEEIVDLLLKKDADVNMKSKKPSPSTIIQISLTRHTSGRQQRPGTPPSTSRLLDYQKQQKHPLILYTIDRPPLRRLQKQPRHRTNPHIPQSLCAGKRQAGPAGATPCRRRRISADDEAVAGG